MPNLPLSRGAEAAADDTAVTSLLNCYLRETGSPAPGTVRLERLGMELATQPCATCPLLLPAETRRRLAG